MDNKVLGSHAGARVRIRFSNYSRLFSCNLTETDRGRRSGSETLAFGTIQNLSFANMTSAERPPVSPRGVINERPIKRPDLARRKNTFIVNIRVAPT